MDRSAGLDGAREDEGQYRLLLDAITDYAIYMLDPQGRVTSWNAGARKFKGYEPAEILGEHFSRFYTDEDRAAGKPAHALRTASSEGRFETEGWRVRKDGGLFWAHVVIDPILRPDGELVGYAKITRDLTERKAAEDALRRSEQEFRLLVQGVTDYAIYMLDPDGRVTTWNAGAQRIKGYRPEEIIGDHFSRFYTEEDRASGLPARGLATAMTVGRFEKEGWRVRKDGTRFWAHVIIDAIRGEGGEVVGFAKITRDVTERMEAQRALEVAREALFQSQKMDAIGQLTGGVAHDFNNLLMAILGSLEMLRKRMEPDPRLTPLIDNAVLGAERGAALTQRMLAFARKQELTLEPVELPSLVRGMTRLLQPSLGPGIDIQMNFPSGLPPVMADANQLEVALLNLAVNARDAMGDTGVITISADARTVEAASPTSLAPGDYVCLCVADTGEGMDEETLARATEPFFTTKGVGKGTGLGLPMVHGVAVQSGGQLVLKSRKGEGVVAELWLPVASSGELSVRSPDPVAAIETPRLVVLAVDDDALVLMNTVCMLEDLGHDVLQATSGREALALLQTGRRLDLVITDQAMPQMTGVQLAEAIKAEWPDLPVVLATGYAELPPGLDPGLPRLSKPFLQRDLARAVAGAAAPALVG
ncbi:MAG TPA: PAS domain S-box protein [Caulobacteraceae bacterium]|jgi:PAS domain S-box-containing protein|nr:PAS domain S-box protein [Caulobacteraceae bacterium]